VSVCEIHKPIGNIRQKSFSEIWRSEEANQIRKSIAARECFCTTEVFMWPSFTYPPTQLVRTMVSAKAWKRPAPLGPDEKLDISVDSETRLPFPSNGHGAEAPQGSAQVKVELQTGD
jgi:hypothetical protein